MQNGNALLLGSYAALAWTVPANCWVSFQEPRGAKSPFWGLLFHLAVYMLPQKNKNHGSQCATGSTDVKSVKNLLRKSLLIIGKSFLLLVEGNIRCVLFFCFSSFRDLLFALEKLYVEGMKKEGSRGQGNGQQVWSQEVNFLCCGSPKPTPLLKGNLIQSKQSFLRKTGLFAGSTEGVQVRILICCSTRLRL